MLDINVNEQKINFFSSPFSVSINNNIVSFSDADDLLNLREVNKDIKNYLKDVFKAKLYSGAFIEYKPGDRLQITCSEAVIIHCLNFNDKKALKKLFDRGILISKNISDKYASSIFSVELLNRANNNLIERGKQPFLDGADKAALQLPALKLLMTQYSLLALRQMDLNHDDYIQKIKNIIKNGGSLNCRYDGNTYIEHLANLENGDFVKLQWLNEFSSKFPRYETSVIKLQLDQAKSLILANVELLLNNQLNQQDIQSVFNFSDPINMIALNQLFLKAIENNDLKLVEGCLMHGAPSIPQNTLDNFLFSANTVEEAKSALEKGAKIYAISPEKNTNFYALDNAIIKAITADNDELSANMVSLVKFLAKYITPHNGDKALKSLHTEYNNLYLNNGWMNTPLDYFGRIDNDEVAKRQICHERRFNACRDIMEILKSKYSSLEISSEPNSYQR